MHITASALINVDQSVLFIV